MRILLTNDDGIEAPGLRVLQQIASELSDDVWTVAPETEQSGASHALTLHEPLRLREINARTFAVKGTPTDCVIMAIKHVMVQSPSPTSSCRASTAAPTWPTTSPTPARWPARWRAPCSASPRSR